MATTSPLLRTSSARSASRRPRPPMSLRQFDAYLLARETLRRLRPSASPCVPPDPSRGASAGPAP
jgi:hypothetical protein